MNNIRQSGQHSNEPLKEERKKQPVIHFTSIPYESINDEDCVIAIETYLLHRIIKICNENDINIFPESLSNEISSNLESKEKVYLLTDKDLFDYIINNCPKIIEYLEYKVEPDDFFSERTIKRNLLSELFLINEFLNE